jgi:enamine deaminase RidA (YjgF/YER057c/UK114 family)
MSDHGILLSDAPFEVPLSNVNFRQRTAHGRAHASAGRPAARTDFIAIFSKTEETRMARLLISSGSTFENEIAYSRAVVDGDWVFVSGTTGFDYLSMTIPEDLVEQTEQCLKNIESALAQAGASLRDVVRVTYILPNAAEFSRCWPILRKYFGEVRPAATMICAGLADPRMRIEIEVTARFGRG